MPETDDYELPSTHWSMVQEAGGQSGQAQRQAMGRVLSRYLPAMTAHVAHCYHLDPQQAEDLVQGFIANKVLEGNLLDSAQQARGRFRTFLLSALDHFAIDEYRYASRKKRTGNFQSLESIADLTASEPAPADVFDIQWARQVLADAIASMRQHCQFHARMDLWEVFEGRVLAITVGVGEPVSYAELARSLGWRSPTQGSNLLVTANRLFGRVLRSVIGKYELGAKAIDEEMKSLYEILSRRGARSLE